MRSISGGYSILSLLPRAILAAAILVVLGGLYVLLVPTVYDGLSPNGEARHELNNLPTAIENFKSARGVSYLPAEFDLRDDYPAPDDPHALYLQKLFPALVTSPAPRPSWVPWRVLGADSALPAQLNGSQCLVFFLAGPDEEGFAAAPSHPAARGGDRIGPFFEFRPYRINPTGEFLDPWDTPYAYFTAVEGDDYEYSDPGNPATFRPGHPHAGRGPQGPGGARPLWKSPTEPVNGRSFQIISAGPDRVFGRGGLWRPGSGDYAPGQPGYDDLANFHPRPLGKP